MRKIKRFFIFLFFSLFFSLLPKKIVPVSQQSEGVKNKESKIMNWKIFSNSAIAQTGDDQCYGLNIEFYM